MEDNNFSDACEHVDCEPIPYFQQLCMTPVSRAHSPATRESSPQPLPSVDGASSPLQTAHPQPIQQEPTSDTLAFYTTPDAGITTPPQNRLLPFKATNANQVHRHSSTASPVSQATSINDRKNSPFADTKVIFLKEMIAKNII